MAYSTKNFTAKEVRCKCGCEEHGVRLFALDRLQRIRSRYGKPMIVTSAYRCESHPDEIHKKKPGQHHLGVAFDIKYNNGAELFELIKLALLYGATGIGVHEDFLHIDFRKGVPVVWVY